MTSKACSSSHRRDTRYRRDQDKLDIIRELENLSFIDRLVKKFFKVGLFIYTYDIFLIYKPKFPGYNLAKYRFYQSEDVAIQWTDSDRLRTIWRRYLTSWLLYTSFKFAILGFLHLRLLEHAGLNQEVNSQQANEVIELINFIGDPLVGKTELAIIGYLVVGFIAQHALLYQPMDFLKIPMDSLIARFYIDPLREIRRTDNQNLEFMNKMMVSADRNVKLSEQIIRSPLRSCMTPVPRRSPSDLIKSIKKRQWNLRPESYSCRWLVHLHKLIDMIILTVPPSGIIFVLVLLVMTLDRATRAKAKQSAYSQNRQQILEMNVLSRIGVLMNSREILTLIEFVTYVLLMSILLGSMMSTALIVTFCQRNTIEGLKADLEATRMKLLQYNLHQTDPHSEPCAQLDLQLIEGLVKIRAGLSDLRASSQFLSRLYSNTVITTLVVFPTIMLLSSMEGSEFQQFGSPILILMWFCNDLIGITSAHVYAKSRNLEKIACSVLAQLTLRCDVERRYIVDDVIADGWRRLVLSRIFNDQRSSVRPFGIALTFDKLLQINFLAISFISIVKAI